MGINPRMGGKAAGKLIALIKDQLGITISSIRTIRHGRTQLSRGAWSWIGTVEGSIMEIGSSYTMTEIVRRKDVRLILIDYELFIQ